MKIRVKNLLRVQTAKVELSSTAKIITARKCSNLLKNKTLTTFRLTTIYLLLLIITTLNGKIQSQTNRTTTLHSF
jgi:hypothetical protein